MSEMIERAAIGATALSTTMRDFIPPQERNIISRRRFKDGWRDITEALLTPDNAIIIGGSVWKWSIIDMKQYGRFL